MSLNAATLRILAAKGLSVEDILEVAEAMEVRKDPTAAERMARHRAKRKAEEEAVTRNVTVVTEASPPNEYISNPPCDSPVEAKASTAPRGRSDRGSKITEDWSPPPVAELSPEAAELAGRWPASVYRAEAEAFRNYWLAESGAKARKSNWNRAWANRIVAVNGRVLREAKFSGNAVPIRPASSAKPSDPAALAAELEQRAEWCDRMGQSLDAEEKRKEARRLRASVPVGDLVGRIAQQARAH